MKLPKLLMIGAIFGIFASACNEIELPPMCTLDDSCTQKQEFLTAAVTDSEPFTVVRIQNRETLGDYFQIYQVLSPYTYEPGTVIVDTANRLLYLQLEDSMARRYPIAVGKEGFQWSGEAVINRKTHWPIWRPTPRMIEEDPELEEEYEGGPKNPLGARSLYLVDLNGVDHGFRIHGNAAPGSIGRFASSGCIRLYNEDIIDLYNRVPNGTKVIVLGTTPPEPEVVVEERIPTLKEQFAGSLFAPVVEPEK